jgi:hypothetical protein
MFLGHIDLSVCFGATKQGDAEDRKLQISVVSTLHTSRHTSSEGHRCFVRTGLRARFAKRISFS